MGQPTLSDVHVDTLLTTLSALYMQEEANFVAGRVFPSLPVAKMSDKYQTFSRADFNRNTMQKRAPATQSAGGGFKVSTGSYLADVWALHKDIDDQTRANQDASINLEVNSTRWLVTQALISREVDWAATFFAASVWTGLLTGVASAPAANQVIQWSDYTNSNPIQDIRTLKRTNYLSSGGYKFNKLVLGRTTYDILIDHPDFVDRVKYGGNNTVPGKVARAAMAELFEIDEVLVMDALVNNGVEGTGLNSNESNAFIGNSKSALLMYTPETVGLDIPASGVTFNWTGFLGANANGTRIKSFYMDEISATRIEIEQAYDHKLVSADMGAWLATIVA